MILIGLKKCFEIGTSYATTGYSKSSMPVGGNMSGNRYDAAMPALPQQQPMADQLKLKIPKDRIKSEKLDYANQSHSNLANAQDTSLTSAPTSSSTSLKIKISKDCLEVRIAHSRTQPRNTHCQPVHSTKCHLFTELQQ